MDDIVESFNIGLVVAKFHLTEEEYHDREEDKQLSVFKVVAVIQQEEIRYVMGCEENTRRKTLPFYHGPDVRVHTIIVQSTIPFGAEPRATGAAERICCVENIAFVKIVISWWKAGINTVTSSACTRVEQVRALISKRRERRAIG